VADNRQPITMSRSVVLILPLPSTGNTIYRNTTLLAAHERNYRQMKIQFPVQYIPVSRSLSEWNSKNYYLILGKISTLAREQKEVEDEWQRDKKPI